MLVEDLPVAVLSIDSALRITSVNQALLDLLETSEEVLLQRNVTEALRPRSVAGEDVLVSGWHTSAHLPRVKRLNEQEVVVRKPSGAEIELIVDGGYERDEAGALTGATLLLRPRHRGPRRPRSGVRIVSAVSHELRSPLTSVRGYTSLLLKRWDDLEDGDRRDMLQQIDVDARRIGRMIGELLDITRIETGRLQLNKVELDVTAVARDVLAKAEMVWPELDAETMFTDGLPRANADADKVEQVLTNLVENACKYASPKGLQVKGHAEGGEIVIEVTDAGQGIPAADLPQLFRQFFKSREGRPTGTGLGLWISRGLIEAHGGEMTATSVTATDSAGGRTGTTFRFTLPQFTDRFGDQDESAEIESLRMRHMMKTR